MRNLILSELQESIDGFLIFKTPATKTTFETYRKYSDVESICLFLVYCDQNDIYPTINKNPIFECFMDGKKEYEHKIDVYGLNKLKELVQDLKSEDYKIAEIADFISSLCVVNLGCSENDAKDIDAFDINEFLCNNY